MTVYAPAAPGGAQPPQPLFTPSTVNPPGGGVWVPGTPFGVTQSTTGTANLLQVQIPLFSGSGITMDQLDAFISTAGDATALIRAGIYLPINQRTPFMWRTDQALFRLLLDCGTQPANGTGHLLWTSGLPIAIPANTWFCFAAVESGVTMSNRWRWQTSGAFSMFMCYQNALAQSANSPSVNALTLTGVSASSPLPTTVTINGSSNIDGGIGFHRIA